LDVKKRFTEEQIIGFLREAESGLPPVLSCAAVTASRKPATTSGVTNSAE
jgi:hypothetical protein